MWLQQWQPWYSTMQQSIADLYGTQPRGEKANTALLNTSLRPSGGTLAW